MTYARYHLRQILLLADITCTIHYSGQILFKPNITYTTYTLDITFARYHLHVRQTLLSLDITFIRYHFHQISLICTTNITFSRYNLHVHVHVLQTSVSLDITYVRYHFRQISLTRISFSSRPPARCTRVWLLSPCCHNLIVHKGIFKEISSNL